MLVDRATIPNPFELPPDLQRLTERHAIELRNEAWPDDLRRLVDAIGSRSRSGRWRWLAGAVALCVVAGVVGWLLLRADGGTDGDGDDAAGTATTRSVAPTTARQAAPSTFNLTATAPKGQPGGAATLGVPDGMIFEIVEIKVINLNNDDATVAVLLDDQPLVEQWNLAAQPAPDKMYTTPVEFRTGTSELAFQITLCRLPGGGAEACSVSADVYGYLRPATG